MHDQTPDNPGNRPTTSQRRVDSAPGAPDRIDGSVRAQPVATVVAAGHARLNSLQVLRGFGMLCIVMFHTQLNYLDKIGVMPFGGLFSRCAPIIDMFFVMSGFVVAYIHARDVGRPARLRNYLFNRLSRIYPLVWTVTALTVVLVVAGHGGTYSEGKMSLWSIFSTAMLLPQPDPLVLVTWTLKYDLFFYLAFALIIVRPRIGWIAFGIWQAAIVVVGLLGIRFTEVPFGYYLHPMSFDIAIGMLCALVFIRSKEGRTIAPAVQWTMLGVSSTAFAVGMLFFSRNHLIEFGTSFRHVLLFGTVTGVMMLSLVMLESAGRIRCSGWLVHAGDAGFAIYLIHASVVGRLVLFAPKPRNVLEADFTCIVISAFAVAVGFGFDRFVDQPLQRALRTLKPFFVAPRRETREVHRVQEATG